LRRGFIKPDMLQIDNYIFSLDILDKKFICDLPLCLGNCCKYGDSGAPLTREEVLILEEIRDIVFPYLRETGRKAIEEQGTSVRDFEGEMVTPLIGHEECAYTIFSGKIYMCGIEKAWTEGKISFRKPLSCHLFPVRLKKFSDFTAVNYQEISICQAARERGGIEKVQVYRFLREPLIRALGEEVYEKLSVAAEELPKNGYGQI
jgi:hypothetical protein